MGTTTCKKHMEAESRSEENLIAPDECVKAALEKIYYDEDNEIAKLLNKYVVSASISLRRLIINCCTELNT